jgi:hypothetical protein
MEFSPTGTDMTAASRIEARGHMEAIIGPISPGARIKAIIPSIANKLGLKLRRARAFWNMEAACIRSEEMDLLRVEARRAEHLRTATQLDGAAHALLALDYEANRSEAASLRAAADRYRNLARGEGAA